MKARSQIVCFFIAWVLLPGWAGHGAEPSGVLIRDMKEWKIVLPSDAIPSEHYAAEELQMHFKLATGILLPAVTDPQKTDGGRIFVGASQSMKNSEVGFETDRFGPEDLRIMVRPSAIAIAGGRPRGTLYGVYTFLEDGLGVRLLTPDHTHVPRHDPGKEIGAMDKSYRPSFIYRFCGSGPIHRNHAFAARRRSNGCFGDIAERFGGESPLELIGHSFSRYLPWNTYGNYQ